MYAILNKQIPINQYFNFANKDAICVQQTIFNTLPYVTYKNVEIESILIQRGLRMTYKGLNPW